MTPECITQRLQMGTKTYGEQTILSHEDGQSNRRNLAYPGRNRGREWLRRGPPVRRDAAGTREVCRPAGASCAAPLAGRIQRRPARGTTKGRLIPRGTALRAE